MPDSTSFLSTRARALNESSPYAPYLRAHFERVEQAHSSERPNGYVGLCVAENRLLWPDLSARVARTSPPPPTALGYDAMVGAMSFRERLASFLGERVFGRPVKPENLAALAGAGAVLELLFFALGDPGDGVLVPTPSYAGFWPDLEARDGLRIVTVPTSSGEDFRLTPEQLDRALAAADRPIRALLFTTPDNPLGRVYTRAEVQAVLDWADSNGLHVVFDEVYALSVFGSTPFTSAASLGKALGDRVHIVWAFSKDFGASGLRCGVLLSENEDVLQTVNQLSYWAACSGQTQHTLGEIVADTAWVEAYIQKLQQTLRTGSEDLSTRLNQHGIPFIPSDSGIFVVLDLRRYLREPTFEGEAELWQRLMDNANL
ncbi:MAG: aminotransferase class I/II-fold pyridoxal phosphate-dependent enzyme, partial [Myxococcota bacterium]